MTADERNQFKDEIVESFRQALHDERSIDDETHRDHHNYIKMIVLKEKIKADRNEKIKAQVFGWGIITALGSIGTGVYHFFTKGSQP